MNFAERFIDLTHWPDSRKVLLLGCLSAPTTLLAALFNNLIQSHAAAASSVDLAQLQPFLIFWLIAQVSVTLLSLLAVRCGWSGRWMTYLYVSLQAPFIIAIIYLYGTMSTPFVAIVPTIVILWALYFDGIIACYGLVVLLLALVGTHLLESAGRLPYAPMLHARTIDAQRSTSWFIANLTAILMLFSFAFSVCLFVLGARRLQARRLQRARAALECSNSLIRRYVPTQLAEQIVNGGYVESARPERRKLTIFFSEIEGFTDASEGLDAESLADVLNRYLSEMMMVADRYGATVNQIIGDSIMIFFGAPQATNDRDHAQRAVLMGLEMQGRMCQLEPLWSERGLAEPLRIRVGINTGYASVGNFGSEGRKLYSGIGVQTNVAARIQAYCEPGKLLISHSTWALVHDRVPCLPRGEVRIKGVHFPLRIYEVVETPCA